MEMISSQPVVSLTQNPHFKPNQTATNVKHKNSNKNYKKLNMEIKLYIIIIYNNI